VLVIRAQCNSVRSSTFRRAAGVIALCLFVGAALGEDAASLFARAQARERAGDLAAAERLYRQVIRIDPRSAEALANLGVVLARQQKYAAAIEQYSRALAIKPALVSLRLILGLALLNSGRAATAVDEIQAYLKSEPGDRRAQQLLANALLESDRYSEAARAFEGLLPGDPGVHLGLGAAYARLGRREDAEQQFRLALSAGDTAAVQLAIGQAYLAANDFDRAIAALKRAVELAPKLPGLHFALGSGYWKQQRVSEALAEWRAELAVDPNSFEAGFALGAALIETRQETEGERQLRSALALRPDHAPTLYYLGRVLWKRGDIRGVKFLEESVGLDPSNRAAHYLLARAYKQQGRDAAAARHFAAVEDLSRRQVAEEVDIIESATK
jgi:tetratricopeptide (TPR) repeat protein